MNDALLKDLEIQWNDHFHMRNQTWKTLNNTILVFLGVVGLEIKNVGDIVLIPAYSALIFIAIIGWAVAAHHRVRQGQKFAFIKKYEEELGLFEFKRELIEKAEKNSGFPGKIFTARFIEITQGGIGIIAFFLLVRRIFVV